MTLKTAPHSNTKFKEFFSSLYLFFCAFFFATKLILCIFCPFPKAHTYLVFSSALANMTKRWNLPEANQTHKVCVGEPGEWLLVALGFLYHTDSSASPIHSAFGSVQQLAANSVLHCSPGLLVALICTCRHPAAETNQQDRVYIQKHRLDPTLWLASIFPVLVLIGDSVHADFVTQCPEKLKSSLS